MASIFDLHSQQWEENQKEASTERGRSRQVWAKYMDM
jgi:hypothetical protein